MGAWRRQSGHGGRACRSRVEWSRSPVILRRMQTGNWITSRGYNPRPDRVRDAFKASAQSFRTRSHISGAVDHPPDERHAETS